MKSLAALIRLEIWLLLISLVSIVAHRIVTGKISTGRMLFEKGGNRNYSPLRLQLLLLIVMTALYQLLQVLKDPTQFPNIPYEALLVLGGGNMAYLGGKVYSLSRGPKLNRGRKIRT
jgi:hypothetical protein